MPMACSETPAAQFIEHAVCESCGASAPAAVWNTQNPTKPTGDNAAVAAISYALDDDDGLTFLRLWFQGDFDVIRREWENVPDQVFIGADPLFGIEEAS
jgi:hypothetical protein